MYLKFHHSFLIDPPSSPKAFDYISKTYNSVIISWDPLHRTEREPPLTGYVVTINPSPKGGPCKSGRCPLLNESAKNYMIRYLQFGINYTITISPINCIGKGDDVSINVLTKAKSIYQKLTIVLLLVGIHYIGQSPLTGYIITVSPKPKGGHCRSGRCPLLNESAKNYTICLFGRGYSP